jgi:hypothetical protein
MPSPNPGGHNDKPWANMLKIVGYQNDKRLLRDLAETVFSAAIAGDMAATAEIGNRLDGRPIQESTITHNRGLVEMSDQELLAILADAKEAAKTIEHDPEETVSPLSDAALLAIARE